MSRSKLEDRTNAHPRKYIVLKRQKKKDNVLAMRISLLLPCLVDQFYPEVGINTVRILEKVGAEVHYPEKQICCGQPFFNSGHWKKAIPLAENTIQTFRSAEMVVAPSGNCVNMIRHSYGKLFRDRPTWLKRAKTLSSKIYELSEFLIHIARVEDLGAKYEAKVTYHDSCQVLRGLGISSEPRKLLQKVRGLELIEMQRSDVCCGSGNSFSIRFPHIAEAMVEEKTKNILAAGVEAVVGCEINCLTHIGGFLKDRGAPIKTLHLADVLVKGI